MEKIYISRKSLLKVALALVIILGGFIISRRLNRTASATREDEMETVITGDSSASDMTTSMAGESTEKATEGTELPQEPGGGSGDNPGETTSSPEEESQKVLLGVHVTGAVKQPDTVVFLAPGGRVLDAIHMAGGPTEEADLSQLNLADYVLDGQKITVPKIGEDSVETVTEPLHSPQGDSAVDLESESTRDLTNINSASKIELMALPGIGETIAERIIAYREQQGPFTAIEEIKNVSGIGESVFADIQDKITIE